MGGLSRRQVTYVYNGTTKTAAVKETTSVELTVAMVAKSPGLARDAGERDGVDNGTTTADPGGSNSGSSSSGDDVGGTVGAVVGVLLLFAGVLAGAYMWWRHSARTRDKVVPLRPVATDETSV